MALLERTATASANNIVMMPTAPMYLPRFRGEDDDWNTWMTRVELDPNFSVLPERIKKLTLRGLLDSSAREIAEAMPSDMFEEMGYEQWKTHMKNLVVRSDYTFQTLLELPKLRQNPNESVQGWVSRLRMMMRRAGKEADIADFRVYFYEGL